MSPLLTRIPSYHRLNPGLHGLKDRGRSADIVRSLAVAAPDSTKNMLRPASGRGIKKERMCGFLVQP